MRARGINYDTGFINRGVSSREPFAIDGVRRELQIIRDDLHCTAVRITGGDPERLDIAARIAAEVGLEVWFSPFTCDLTDADMLALLADCAGRAERLRQAGAEVVFVAGAEISLLNHGFLPGDTLGERMELLNDFPRLRAAIAQVPARVNDFLARAVAVVREQFGGRVTYASMPFEGVDWTPFDIISVACLGSPRRRFAPLRPVMATSPSRSESCTLVKDRGNAEEALDEGTAAAPQRLSPAAQAPSEPADPPAGALLARAVQHPPARGAAQRQAVRDADHRRPAPGRLRDRANLWPRG